jgi:NDP-sugar pyrophosphorylase family protein
MKAVILAAGEGRRLRPLTEKTPKPLLKVADKELLRHLVEKFPPNIDELVIVVGYLGDQIIKYCGENFLGRPVRYVWQKEQAGTYPALELCKPLLGNNERFGLFFPDDLLDKKSITNLLAHETAVVVKEVTNPKRFGIVELHPDESIKSIEEKPDQPKSNCALTNAYVLNTDIFKYPPPCGPTGEYYLSWSIGEMAKNRKVFAVKAGFWFPIATPEDLNLAQKLLTSEVNFS